jgi:hypothetical protein
MYRAAAYFLLAVSSLFAARHWPTCCDTDTVFMCVFLGGAMVGELVLPALSRQKLQLLAAVDADSLPPPEPWRPVALACVAVLLMVSTLLLTGQAVVVQAAAAAGN